MKTIEIDPLDPRSITRAINEIKQYESERKEKIEKYIRRLCEEGANAAQAAFGDLVHVAVSPDGKGIIAQGDQVVFLEFGTGVKTTDHDLSGPLNIEIMPRSWSEGPHGKHTWSTWLNGGEYNGRWMQRRFTEYPYNTEPRAGMWAAYKAIEAAQERIAHEVFDN